MVTSAAADASYPIFDILSQPTTSWANKVLTTLEAILAKLDSPSPVKIDGTVSVDGSVSVEPGILPLDVVVIL